MNLVLALVPVLAFLLALRMMDSFKLVRPASVTAAIASGAAAALICIPLHDAILRRTALDAVTFSRYVAPVTEEILKAAFVAFLFARRRVGFAVDAAVQGFAAVTPYPGVEQAVGRAGVEAGDRAVPVDDRDVGDAAEVQHHALAAGGAEQGPVEQGGQRRALAAGRDIGAAEVADRADAGALRDQGGAAQLDGLGARPGRRVPDRLAVRADGADACGSHAGLAQQAQRRVGEMPRDLCIQFRQLRGGGAAAARRQALKPRGEVRRVGQAEGRAQLRLSGREGRQRRIDAVAAGAGNHAEPEFALTHGSRTARRIPAG